MKGPEVAVPVGVGWMRPGHCSFLLGANRGFDERGAAKLVVAVLAEPCHHELPAVVEKKNTLPVRGQMDRFSPFGLTGRLARTPEDAAGRRVNTVKFP
jgi:hypothetical protein